MNQAKSASPSASASAQPSDNPSQTTTVTPVISSVSVLSWKDDKGDHEEMAVNMIDGDAKTSWHSRYFDYNQFLDDTAVTVLVKFEKKSTVSEITLTMDPSTSGGEGVVRAVDPNSPRAGNRNRNHDVLSHNGHQTGTPCGDRCHQHYLPQDANLARRSRMGVDQRAVSEVTATCP